MTANSQVIKNRFREPVLEQKRSLGVEPETGGLDRLLHVHGRVDEVVDHLRRRVQDSVTPRGSDRQT